MFRLLIPVDFSPDTKNFIEKGFNTLPKVDAAYFIYVVPLGMKELEDFVDVDSIKQAKEKAEEKMLNLLKDINIKVGKVNHSVTDGDPARVLIDLGNSGKFDAILIGHRGYAYVEEFFVGSVTLKVISKVRIPVLVVKKGKEEQDIFEMR